MVFAITIFTIASDPSYVGTVSDRPENAKPASCGSHPRTFSSKFHNYTTTSGFICDTGNFGWN